jgi:coenzyme F420 hydrogenase subunit beta
VVRGISEGSSYSASFSALKDEVIDAGLCTRCGSCVGVCPDKALKIDDLTGDCLPVQVDGCSDCGLCHVGCSGKDVPFAQLNQQVFGRQPSNMLLGNMLNLFVGHASQRGVRSRGASGGVITAVLKYLLETGKIDGAIVLVMDETTPWVSKPIIARSVEEIEAAAQSKYSLSPVNTILSQLAEIEGRFAYVGLPCQVHSLRKLQAAGHAATLKIEYVIGSYCGNILHFDAVRSFLRNNGVESVEEVADLQYRAGEWPGQMQVTLRSGEVIALKKFYANYLIPFFMVDRCTMCTDLANEFADIACGDAWSPVYEERGKGWSLVMGRTKRGAGLLEEMADGGYLSLQGLEEQAAIGMHSHMLDFKKRGSFLRMERREKRGVSVPDYGFKAVGIPWQRRLFESLLTFLFWVCSQPLSRWAVEHFPVRITGELFEIARRSWKRMTRTTKRRGLVDVQFENTMGGGRE